MRGFVDYEYTIGTNQDDAEKVIVTEEDVITNIPDRVKRIAEADDGTVSPYLGTTHTEAAIRTAFEEVNGWCLINTSTDSAMVLFDDEDMWKSYAGFEAVLATDAYCDALREGKFGPGEAYEAMEGVSDYVRCMFEHHMGDLINDIIEENNELRSQIESSR